MNHNVVTSIATSPYGMHTLRIIIRGRFDLRLGFQLWPKCALEEGIFNHYVFDFESCPDLRDSGLAWLLMFSRRADANGQTVKLANLTMASVGRLAISGLTAELEVAQAQGRPPAVKPERPRHEAQRWNLAIA
jgi:hypothetical protein